MNERAARAGGAVAMAAAVALASVGGAVLLLDSSDPAPSSSNSESGSGVLERTADATPADEPFPAMTETEVSVGATRLRVVVADDGSERTRGLRERSDLGDYDGMLFVFDGPTTTSFTMSTVPVALDIGFFDDAGRVVDRLRMEPCAGSEAECPVYRPDASFRFALETLAGDLPRGRLAG
ncbi:MAG: DUF192 domain-containing protein [Acidimicrobiia bacterium]